MAEEKKGGGVEKLFLVNSGQNFDDMGPQLQMIKL